MGAETFLVLAVIDDGDLDWKVLAVAVDDPLAAKYYDLDDIAKAVIKAGVRERFRWLSTLDDNPLNAFGFDERYLKAALEVKKVIDEAWKMSWKKLQAGTTEA